MKHDISRMHVKFHLQITTRIYNGTSFVNKTYLHFSLKKGVTMILQVVKCNTYSYMAFKMEQTSRLGVEKMSFKN